MSTWLEARTVSIAAMTANNSVLVEEIQFVSTAAWNWDGITVEVLVYAIPALMWWVPIYWTESSV